MNNSLIINSSLLTGRVAYIPARGESQEGFIRACWLNNGGNLVFLIELDRGDFTEVLASYCKKLSNE